MDATIFDDPYPFTLQYALERVHPEIAPENRIENPGDFHSQVKCLSGHQVVYTRRLTLLYVRCAGRILRLESSAFSGSNMAMPRWVFYDCAIVPGFVAGFAAKRSALTPKALQALEVAE